MRARATAVLLLSLAAGLAGAQESRYVSDELVLVLRDSPRAEGAAKGVVTSGTRVQVLDTDASSGYAKIRTSDGREGWILNRYLKAEPVARERAQRLEKELAAAQAELKKLKDDHARLLADFSRISGGQPIASQDVIAETEAVRQQLKAKEQEVAALRKRYDVERASQQTLALGGGLVAGGFLLALLLRWLWPKKRWGDL